MELVTGGMGFIGSQTARALLDAGSEVVISQFRARREPAFLSDELGKRLQVAQLDILDFSAVMETIARHKVTGIVHMAFPGLGSLPAGADFQANMLGLLNLLEATRIAGLRRFTIASSNAVYGGVPAGPLREDLPLRTAGGSAIEVYKKAKEILALHYADRTGVDVVAVRIADIYGPAYHSMRNLPSRLCHAAARGAAPDYEGVLGGVPYAGNEADLCYVKDCARGVTLLHQAERLNHRVYNLGSGRATPFTELAAAINTVAPTLDLSFAEGRTPGLRATNYMDLTRIHDDVGYTPAYDIHAGVADYVAWLRANPR